MATGTVRGFLNKVDVVKRCGWVTTPEGAVWFRFASVQPHGYIPKVGDHAWCVQPHYNPAGLGLKQTDSVRFEPASPPFADGDQLHGRVAAGLYITYQPTASRDSALWLPINEESWMAQYTRVTFRVRRNPDGQWVAVDVCRSNEDRVLQQPITTPTQLRRPVHRNPADEQLAALPNTRWRLGAYPRVLWCKSVNYITEQRAQPCGEGCTKAHSYGELQWPPRAAYAPFTGRRGTVRVSCFDGGVPHLDVPWRSVYPTKVTRLLQQGEPVDAVVMCFNCFFYGGCALWDDCTYVHCEPGAYLMLAQTKACPSRGDCHVRKFCPYAHRPQDLRCPEALLESPGAAAVTAATASGHPRMLVRPRNAPAFQIATDLLLPSKVRDPSTARVELCEDQWCDLWDECPRAHLHPRTHLLRNDLDQYIAPWCKAMVDSNRLYGLLPRQAVPALSGAQLSPAVLPGPDDFDEEVVGDLRALLENATVAEEAVAIADAAAAAEPAGGINGEPSPDDSLRAMLTPPRSPARDPAWGEVPHAVPVPASVVQRWQSQPPAARAGRLQALRELLVRHNRVVLSGPPGTRLLWHPALAIADNLLFALRECDLTAVALQRVPVDTPDDAAAFRRRLAALADRPAQPLVLRVYECIEQPSKGPERSEFLVTLEPPEVTCAELVHWWRGRELLGTPQHGRACQYIVASLLRALADAADDPPWLPALSLRTVVLDRALAVRVRPPIAAAVSAAALAGAPPPLGRLMWQLLGGQADDDLQQLNRAALGFFPHQPHRSLAAADLLRRLLEFSPSGRTRGECAALLGHPFFWDDEFAQMFLCALAAVVELAPLDVSIVLGDRLRLLLPRGADGGCDWSKGFGDGQQPGNDPAFQFTNPLGILRFISDCWRHCRTRVLQPTALLRGDGQPLLLATYPELALVCWDECCRPGSPLRCDPVLSAFLSWRHPALLG